MIPRTLNDLALRARDLWPDRPFLQTRSGTEIRALSYKKTIDSAERLAGSLLASGLQPKDYIALLSENRPEWIVCYFGIVFAGAVAVPIDSLLPTDEILTVLSLGHVRALLTTQKFADTLRGVTSHRVTLPALHIIENLHLDDIHKPHSEKNHNLPTTHPQDLAAIIFTSGTTGFSKGVMLSHENLCSDVQAIMDAECIGPDDNFHLILPLHHTYSSTVNMLGALALGARATFATSYKSRDLIDDIRIAQVTTLVGVPLVFENIMIGIRRAVADAARARRFLFRLFFALSRIGTQLSIPLSKTLFRSLRKKIGMSSIRRMISGGAALRPEVNRFFETLGIELLQGYGLTETSPVLSVNRPGRNRIGSVGPALPGVELRIHEPDDNDNGEVCARGPMIMLGYFENPTASAEVLRDGWFHTGDAGFLDNHGHLHITGRIKNVIVTSGGKNIHPEEIEARLDLSPYILESLVLGIRRKRSGGEELAALIVPQSSFIQSERERGHDVDVEAEIKNVIDDYNQSVPSYRGIRRWRIQEQEFEKTSTRKIRRYLYKDAFPADANGG